MESPMNKIRVESWSELQDELFSDAYNPELGRYRSREMPSVAFQTPIISWPRR